MGSKTELLRGRLGEIILQEASDAPRFVDLFAGSGSVGQFVAESTKTPVLTVDLQLYSKVLAGAVVERSVPLTESDLVKSWTRGVESTLANDAAYARLVTESPINARADVLAQRQLSMTHEKHFITSHYGGHYFSAKQAYVLDALHAALPSQGIERTLALAAILRVASAAAAAPGHTAQPFQPTDKLLPYIATAWRRDVLADCQREIERLAARHAMIAGVSIVGDANAEAEKLGEGDVVFCDPPYSSVQYSRFYHVLEGIARGGWSAVSGAGRAPALESRGSSSFSLRTKAQSSLGELLTTLHKRRCIVIVTFPDASASNGLSADMIESAASESWHVTRELVDSIHSTLGGAGGDKGRGGRRALQEAVLVMKPKGSSVASP